MTRAVYAVEDLFDLLPIHWMWWPAIGAVAVGVIGYFAPNTLGVGYDNISHAISYSLTVKAMAILCVLKFTSWCIALGSGTSGGTLAPLFTIGSTLGALMGVGARASASSRRHRSELAWRHWSEWRRSSQGRSRVLMTVGGVRL